MHEVVEGGPVWTWKSQRRVSVQQVPFDCNVDIGVYGQELEGKFCVVYTRSGVPKLSSWAIGKLIENGHFVETYLEWFAIESINELGFVMRWNDKW